jgi:D-alanyl-D-alanine carboxypeptidase
MKWRLPKPWVDFLTVLVAPWHRRVSLILAGLFLVLLPPQNAYSRVQLPEGEPVVRQVDFVVPKPETYPVNVTGTPLPWVSARSVIVVDVESKAVLAAKNPDWQLYPASTTKMMTALVAWEAYDPDQVVTIEQNGAIGQTMKLVVGEQITVKNLLYGLLVGSGNDAAEVLARHYPGGEVAFVERMNQKAGELHLSQTQFRNPSGVEAYGHVSTVHDLALLGSEVMRQSVLAQMVGTDKITATDITGEIAHELTNINQLVVDHVWGVKGIKTGWTEYAGECLVTYVERDGRKIMIALLGSADRFGETRAIIDWVFANHEWQKISI